MIHAVPLENDAKVSQALNLIAALKSYKDSDFLTVASRSKMLDLIIYTLKTEVIDPSHLDKILVGDCHLLIVHKNQLLIAYENERILNPILKILNLYITH